MTWESHNAIATLIYRYAECVDTADFDGIGALFAHGCLRAEGTTMRVEGADAVAGYYRAINKVQPDGTLGTRHITTNLIIEIDEDGHRARARSYFCVVQATPNLPLQPIITGSYRDSFVRTDGEWRFAERMMAPNRFGELGEHLTFDPEQALRDAGA